MKNLENIDAKICSLCGKSFTTISIYDKKVPGIICLDCCLKKLGTSRKEIYSQFENYLKSQPIVIDFTSQVEKFTNDKNFAISEEYLYTLSSNERLELNRCVVNPSLCKRLFDNYMNMDDYISAINIAKTALTLNPFNINILLDLAFAYRLSKDYDNAIKLYLKILKTDSENDESLAHLGETYFEKGEYILSQKVLEKLVELVPNFSRAWDYLARIYQHLGTIEKYQKAITIRDKHYLPSPLVYKGYVKKKWINKDHIPKILIRDHPKTIEYTIVSYKKKDALSTYNSLEINELIEVFEDGRIFSLGKPSRDSWDIENYLLDNLKIIA